MLYIFLISFKSSEKFGVVLNLMYPFSNFAKKKFVGQLSIFLKAQFAWNSSKFEKHVLATQNPYIATHHRTSLCSSKTRTNIPVLALNWNLLRTNIRSCFTYRLLLMGGRGGALKKCGFTAQTNVPDPKVFGSPKSVSQRYGSGWILPSSSKNSKKTLIFYSFVIF